MKNEFRMDKEYIGIVRDNNDSLYLGRVKMIIPNFTDGDEGTQNWLWAYPYYGNAGYEKNDKEHGSTSIPKIGQFMNVVFLQNNPSIPFYKTPVKTNITKVLPECRVGDNPSEKVVVQRMESGRAIVLSDDPSDERTEITGKKRLYDPKNGENSVYTIQSNQNTILIDEREGKEKIVITDHKGDYIYIDIENKKVVVNSESELVINSVAKMSINTEAELHIKGEANINIDGANILLNCGASSPTAKDDYTNFRN